MKQKFLPALLLLSLAIFQACKKDREENQPKEQETIGVYVLYEGTIGNNNSGISYYNLKTGQSDPEYFKTVNGYDLGETAVDLQQYGTKIYCVVSGKQNEQKSFVEIINPATGKSIKRIPFNGTSSGFMPRYMAFYKDKAYVSCYDGKIRRIDTTSLSIDATVETGGAIEGIAVTNGKLYAANSAHYLFPDALNKNTVSVIELNSFTKLKDISVHYNPQRIFAASNGTLYLTASGNYDDIGSAYQKIDSQTDEVTNTFDSSLGSVSMNETKAFAITNPYSNPSIKELNISTGKLENNFISDATTLTTAYGISVNAVTGDVVVCDVPNFTSPGKAYYFKADGKLAVTITTGINPNSAVFIYGTK